MKKLLLNPLIVALDVDSDKEALAIADELQGVAGAFKLGPRLLYRYGAGLVQQLSQRASIFVDCKFHDIPSTMIAAVCAAFESGASLITVHASAGPEALLALAELEKDLNQVRPCKILCVSILTSFGEDGLPSVFKKQSIAQHVQGLVADVRASGLTGVVCSAAELPQLRGQGLFLVTPGIRFADGAADDQKRIVDPSEAMRAGASALVVGRPILTAVSKRAAAEKFLRSIQVTE